MSQENELIAGRYRLVSQVGRGAMGMVWRAEDERLDRVVAVKQLLDRDDQDRGDQAGRLGTREGRVAARLRHPHAIMIHDVVEHDGLPCLIMEYFASRSLSDLVADRGVLPPDLVARIGAQVASALAEAHADGIVHRDVKPGNVLIAEDGTAKIADFGISRSLGDGTMTGGDIIAGTPAYLAPEVAGGDGAGFSSDVFSLGATLYAAVEGRPPFGVDDNPIALLRRVATGDIIPPRTPGPLTDVVLWMLRPHPGERPTMREAQAALAAVADGQPARLPTPPRPLEPTLALPARRARRHLIIAGAGAAALVAIGVVIGTLISDTPGTGQAVAGTPTGTATSTTAAPPPDCVASYEIIQRWPGGYQVEVTVRNARSSALTGWKVRWTMPPGHTIDGLWRGDPSQEGSSVTVSDAGYNAVIAPDAAITFGFTARAADGAPTEPAVDCASD